VLVREPVQELVPGRELGQGLELGQEPALELEPVLELGQERVLALVPHKQPSSRLTTMPVGLIIFSFSSKNSFA